MTLATQSSAATYEMNCGDLSYRLVNNFFKKALFERRDGKWSELKTFSKDNCKVHCNQKVEIYDDGARKDYFNAKEVDDEWQEDKNAPLYVIYDFYKNTKYISFMGNTVYCEKVE